MNEPVYDCSRGDGPARAGQTGWRPGDPVYDEQHPTAKRLGLPNDGSDPVLSAYGFGYAQAMRDSGRCCFFSPGHIGPHRDNRADRATRLWHDERCCSELLSQEHDLLQSLPCQAPTEQESSE